MGDNRMASPGRGTSLGKKKRTKLDRVDTMFLCYLSTYDNIIARVFVW
jgi:hypothetical protein